MEETLDAGLRDLVKCPPCLLSPQVGLERLLNARNGDGRTPLHYACGAALDQDEPGAKLRLRGVDAPRGRRRRGRGRSARDQEIVEIREPLILSSHGS